MFKFSSYTLLVLSFVFFTSFGTNNSVQSSQIILNSKSANLQLDQAEEAYNSGDIATSHAIIKRIKPILQESTELHAQLYESLKDESSAKLTAEKEKQQTIEFAKLRDKANYLAGMISIKQGNNREAVKHLVQVVESQRTTQLGEKAYNALRNIGFSPKLKLADQI